MAHISLTNITYTGNNPDKFTAPISFKIEFEIAKPVTGSNISPLKLQLIHCLELEWRFIYFGDAKNEEHDQVLDTIEMDLLSKTGQMKFNVAVKAPDP